MEASIEELNQEIAYRADYLEKERTEVATLSEQINKELIYIEEQKKNREGKQKENERAIMLNKKLQREIEKLDKQKQLLEADIVKYKKERSEHVSHLKTFEQQVLTAADKMEKLLETEPWIRAEEPFFGKQGTQYDFDNVEPLLLSQEIKQMEEERDELKKKFDPKVEELAKKNQEIYNELERKRDTISADKDKLVETIAQLDLLRNQDIKKTVVEVSKSIGEIYSVLLPGTGARLHPIYSEESKNSEIVGLELKVSFGGAEKESLSELSGGQKSLLALSLILALLKYQPAPFYILDEIDSALDLSHTQNIGLMIRKYFKASQFLIVSLKQGLFQNANVLFQVQFVDNRSTVRRL